MVIVQTFYWRYELFREVLNVFFQNLTRQKKSHSRLALVWMRPSLLDLRNPDQFVAFVLRFNKLQPKQLHFVHNETSSRAHAIPPCICSVRHSASVETFVCSASSSQSRSIFVCICHVRNHIFHLHFFSLFVSICCAYRGKKLEYFRRCSAYGHRILSFSFLFPITKRV